MRYICIKCGQGGGSGGTVKPPPFYNCHSCKGIDTMVPYNTVRMLAHFTSTDSFKLLDKNPLPPNAGKVDILLEDGSLFRACEVHINPRTVGVRDNYDILYCGGSIKRLYVESDLQADTVHYYPPVIAWRQVT